MDLVLISIGLGLLAVIYGFVTSRQVLNSGAGNEKMQEIAGAIQEGDAGLQEADRELRAGR